MLFNVIGYDNQIMGQVEAKDAVEAWSEAGKRFNNILDVREIISQYNDQEMVKLYHGTPLKNLSFILTQGLIPGGIESANEMVKRVASEYNVNVKDIPGNIIKEAVERKEEFLAFGYGIFLTKDIRYAKTEATAGLEAEAMFRDSLDEYLGIDRGEEDYWIRNMVWEGDFAILEVRLYPKEIPQEYKEEIEVSIMNPIPPERIMVLKREEQSNVI